MTGLDFLRRYKNKLTEQEPIREGWISLKGKLKNCFVLKGEDQYKCYFINHSRPMGTFSKEEVDALKLKADDFLKSIDLLGKYFNPEDLYTVLESTITL